MEINQSKGNLFSLESSSGDQWGEHVNDMFFSLIEATKIKSNKNFWFEMELDRHTPLQQLWRR